MPNIVAYMALIIWPLVSFKLFKKLPAIDATFWTILGGFLLLPVGVKFDPPLLPPFDKESIPAISAFLGCIFISREKISLISRSGLERWLVIILLAVPFVTVINNLEPSYGQEALTYHDILAMIINQYIGLISFFLGLKLIKSYDDQIRIFRFLSITY